MKSERNILIAFILNLSFSIFEFFGGIYTGSVAIASDAVHDLGDALSIGIAYYLERLSKKKADEIHTYGYARYSLLGSLITTLILIFGSVLVIYNAVRRVVNPVVINYNGMVGFAIIGVVVNFAAAFFTRDGDSLNQKAVNLHMIEDVLGWVVVLIGAVAMKFTDFSLLDPILSICVASFILVNAYQNLKETIGLLLEKTPDGIDVKEIRKHISNIDGIVEIHDLHIWSIDGQRCYATLHIVVNDYSYEIKKKVRKELQEHNIVHTTIELETTGEPCEEKSCHSELNSCVTNNSHHHHHHKHNHKH